MAKGGIAHNQKFLPLSHYFLMSSAPDTLKWICIYGKALCVVFTLSHRAPAGKRDELRLYFNPFEHIDASITPLQQTTFENIVEK